MSVFFRRRGKAIELAPDPLPIYVAGDRALRNGATLSSQTVWQGQYGQEGAFSYQSDHLYISAAWNSAGTAITTGYVNIKIPVTGYSKLVVTARNGSSYYAILGYSVSDTLDGTFAKTASIGISQTTKITNSFDIAGLDVIYLKVEHARGGVYIYDIHLE